MYLANLDNVPVRVTNPRGYIAMAKANNDTAALLYVKFYNSTTPPTAATVPNKCFPVAAGEDEPLPIFQSFANGCYVAASLTPGASLDAVGAGLTVNVAGEDVL